MMRKKIARELLQVAKLLTGFVSSYRSLRDGGYVFLSTKIWPKAVVHPIGDKFAVIRFHPMKKALSSAEHLDTFDTEDAIELTLMTLFSWPKKTREELELAVSTPEGLADFISTFIFKIKYHFQDEPSYESFMQGLRSEKLMEIAVLSSDIMSKEKLFNYLVTKEKMSIPIFEKLFGQMDMAKVTEDFGAFKHNNWEILVHAQSKMPIEEINHLLDQAEQHINSKGLGKLAYGNIMTVNTLGGGKLADYSIVGDSIRVKTNRRKHGGRELNDFLHELGHRYWYKFMSTQDKATVNTQFMILRRFGGQYSDHKRVQKGDVIVDKANGTRYHVLEVRMDNYKVTQEGIENKIFAIRAMPIYTGQYYIEGKGALEKEDFSAYFPTAYALKNAEEMFAELFATWLTTGIKDPAKSLIEGIVK